MYVIIIGGGRIGKFLIDMLIDEGNQVVVIEKDPESVRYIAENYDVLAIKGDGAEAKYLEDANIHKADVLVAATGNDQVNFVACQLAKSRYEVAKVVARTSNPTNKILYEKLGVDVAISTTEASARALYSGIEGFSSLITFGKGDVILVQASISSQSPVVDKRIKDIHLPWGCLISSIYRQGDIIIPQGNEIIKEKDQLAIMTKKQLENKVKQIIIGKVK